MLNWKCFEGSGRDLLEIPILEFAYKYNENHSKTKVLIAEDLAEIWMKHLLNTNLQLYHYMNPHGHTHAIQRAKQ